MPHLTEHVVVLHWTHDSCRLVQTLHAKMFAEYKDRIRGNSHEPDPRERELDVWCPIVVVSENVDQFPDDDCFEDTSLMPGSPLSEGLLRRANVQTARCVLIVAKDGVDNADDLTLMVALKVRKVINEERAKSADVRGYKRAHVVAEVQSPANATYFRSTEATGIDEVICEKELGLRVMAQASISPGLTPVLGELLEYSREGNEIYQIEIPREWEGRPVTSLRDLYKQLGLIDRNLNRWESGLLLGVARMEEGKAPRYLVNPSRGQLESAALGKFREGDKLIVMAHTIRDACRVVGWVDSTEESPRAAAGAWAELPRR